VLKGLIQRGAKVFKQGTGRPNLGLKIIGPIDHSVEIKKGFQIA
jgi:hypothetical protein